MRSALQLNVRVIVVTLIGLSSLVIALPTHAAGNDTERFVADDPTPLDWSNPNAPPKGSSKQIRKPASSHVAAQGPVRRAPRLERKYFAAGGKQYTLLNKLAGNGRILESNLITDNHMEIARDPRGRGFMDSWEFVTADRRIYMHEPRNGHFQRMDIEQVTAKFVYSMQLARTKQGKYRLYSVKPRLRVPQYSMVQSHIVAGCQETEPALQLFAGQVMDKIKGDSSALDSVLNRQDWLLDKSCTTGAFSEKGKQIKAGIKEVFMSDAFWSQSTAEKVAKEKKEQSASEQGRYLQCLRYHKLDTHASRIESALATYLHNLGNQFFYWKIKCDVSKETNAKADTWGMYMPEVGRPPTITLFDKLDANNKAKGRTPPEPSYAQTFFHEMLHYSLIPDGPMTEAVEQCCAQTNPETPACKKLDELVEAQVYKERVNNQAINNLKDQYPLWQQYVREHNTDAQAGDVAREDLETKVGKVYKDLEKTGCKFDSANEITAQCQEKLKERIQETVDNSFSNVSDPDRTTLRRLARAIYNSGGSQAELAKQCPAHAFNFWRPGGDLLAQLRALGFWLVPTVNAAVHLNHCEIAKESAKDKDWWVLPPKTVGSTNSGERSTSNIPSLEEVATDGGMASTLIATESEMDEVAKGGSSQPPLGAPVSGGESRRYPQRPSDGPPRPDYANDNVTSRQTRILRDLEQYKRTNSEADSLTRTLVKNTVLNEARADSASSRKASISVGENHESSHASGKASGAKSASVTVAVKTAEMSDPLAHLSKQSGGVLKGAAAEAESPAPLAVRNMSITGSSRTPASLKGVESGTRVASLGGVSLSGGPRAQGRGVADAQSVGAQAAGGAAGSLPDGRVSSGPAAQASDGKDPSGVSAKTASAAPAGKSPEPNNAKSDPRAARAMLQHLSDKRYFKRVKPELARVSVIKAMKRHAIQVKDDEDRVVGSENPQPDRKLAFCKSEQRLVVVGQCKK